MSAGTETIFALASGAGAAGIAVVRISGPASVSALRRLAGRVPPPRRAARVALSDPATGAPIDDGIALVFPAPASYTGEDVVELQIHGSRATIAALTGALSRVDGIRLARPGEFSRRAFDNGKLDLTAAEGLADLIAAETEAQRLQALRQMRGDLGALYEDWRARLMRVRAHVEATIDFSEEEDAPDALSESDFAEMEGILESMTQHLADNRSGERVRDGAVIAIVGPPNVGKSSLLNALAGREAAIVTDRPGTTRDVVEVPLEIAGFPVRLADSAGLRETGDPVEREGVRRALVLGRSADVCLLVMEAPGSAALGPDEAALLESGAIPVLSKADLPRANGASVLAGRAAHRVSSVTGEGLDQLRALLADRVAALGAVEEMPAITRARHREAVTEAKSALGAALETGDAALCAEQLRLAARALGRITGRVGVEDMLDVIFSEFCIGK